MSTRRKFLFDCSYTVAALALLPPGLVNLRAAHCAVDQSIDRLPYAMLADQVNTTFRVRALSGRTVELTLLKAPLARPPRPGRRRAPDADNERFSLVFSGPKNDLIESAIIPFEHDRLGRFEMYIGPIGSQDTRSVRYESVFNRPAPAGNAQAKLI